MGYDSDHASRRGRGRAARASRLDTIDDMEMPVRRHPPRRGHDLDDDQRAGGDPARDLRRGRRAAGRPARRSSAARIQNDILKEYIAQKEWIFPPAAVDAHRHRHDRVLRRARCRGGTRSRSAATTSARPARRRCRSWRSRWPTASATSQAAVERGLDVDDFAPRLSFFFNAHNDFFEEIAKFRAARRIWAQHHARALRRQDRPALLMLRFHTQTAGVSLTAQQPLNNVVRTTIQALAAVLGGTQSLHTNTFDEALALPTEEAVTVALRTQQIIAEETGVANTIDPLGGSYFVEALTDRMERGGRGLHPTGSTSWAASSRAIEHGFPQREIADAAYRYQQADRRGEKTIVGVNKLRGGRRQAARDPQDRPRRSRSAQLARSWPRSRPRATREASPRGLEAVRRAAREERQPDAAHRRGGARRRDGRRDLGRRTARCSAIYQTR